MSASDRYNPLSMALHWLTALVLVGLFCAGLVLEDLPKGDFKGQIIGLHKGVGALVIAIVVLRLALRAVKPAPDLPASMPEREVLIAKLGHLALYVLMIAVPLAGIVMSQSGGHAVNVMGWTLPELVGKDHDLHEIFEEVHGFLAWTLAAVVGGHVLAALRHRFMLKDDVMSRMLPGGF